MFYTDIEPPDDSKLVPDKRKIVDDSFIKKVESYMKWQKIEDATIQWNDDTGIHPEMRKSKIHWMNNPEFQRVLIPIYQEVVAKVRHVNDRYWGYRVDGWEPFQYTEYDESYKGYYDWHMDSGPKNPMEDRARKISFSLGLNDADEYEGGELVLNLGSKSIHSYRLSKGEALVFPSHILHKVTPVTKGFRKVIVGWGLGPRI